MAQERTYVKKNVIIITSVEFVSKPEKKSDLKYIEWQLFYFKCIDFMANLKKIVRPIFEKN